MDRGIVMRACCFVPLFFFVGLMTTSLQGQESKKRTNPEPPKIVAIDEALQKFVDDGTISGAVTFVAQHGQTLHYSAVGLSNITLGKEMKHSSLFAIASMTKPVVATALMILQDEGKLDIDDNVSKYIPTFADVKLQDGSVPPRQITIRDCVTHTSGLAGNQIFSGSLESSVNALAKKPLAFVPGAKWQYSPGLNVAGRIIEIVAEQPLQFFLQKRIFNPLGMSDTTFFPNSKQIQRVASLYEPGEKKPLVATLGFLGDLSQIEAPNPSGGLISHGRDMFRFYQMILNNGKFRRKQIVSAAAVKQMTTPQTGDLKTGFTPGNTWGLGWCIVREPQGVTGMLSAGTYGHGGAYGTQGWVDPQTQAIYVLMIQRTKLPNSDGSEVRKVFQQVASEQLKH